MVDQAPGYMFLTYMISFNSQPTLKTGGFTGPVPLPTWTSSPTMVCVPVLSPAAPGEGHCVNPLIRVYFPPQAPSPAVWSRKDAFFFLEMRT